MYVVVIHSITGERIVPSKLLGSEEEAWDLADFLSKEELLPTKVAVIYKLDEVARLS